MNTFTAHLASMLTLATFAAAQTPDIVERDSYRAHLAAAYASHELGHAADARRWLDGAPAGLRGWEWSYLNGLFAESMAATPDDRHLACSSSDHTVGLVDARTGEVAST